MLIMDSAELKQLIKYLKNESKECIKLYMERLIEMNKRPKFYMPWTKEYEDKMLRIIDKEEARNEGLEKGKTEGSQLAEIETTKKMLKDGLAPETIKKYVTLSLSKINEIKNCLL